MNLSISGAYSAPPDFSTSSSTPAPTQRTPQPAPAAEAYTVKLTQAQQVSELSAQGESASQIAANLGTTTAAVDLDLGITTQATTTPVPAAHASKGSAPATPATAPAAQTVKTQAPAAPAIS
jgi:hypothetical protein